MTAILFIIIRRKKSFRKKNNYFNSQSFFPSHDFAHDAKFVNRSIDGLHNTYVGRHGG